jgi:cephalosporin hydroxylase
MWKTKISKDLRINSNDHHTTIYSFNGKILIQSVCCFFLYMKILISTEQDTLIGFGCFYTNVILLRFVFYSFCGAYGTWFSALM